MKTFKLGIMAFFAMIALTFNGCTGILTGKEYTKEDFRFIYKVVTGGVEMMLSASEIKAIQAQQPDVEIKVVGSFKLVTPPETEQKVGANPNTSTQPTNYTVKDYDKYEGHELKEVPLEEAEAYDHVISPQGR